ncbi:MAG: class I SAM-dependent methyltransferase [Cellvibrio sp.]|uniref:class I SAM-dependent methyltransferase n=1 Tax=Cellvibrio sp. TaxID=1965322 RepID=UPI00271E6428|nr:class I SAM-dependent methyltransferase [Cellvibrio sp.]
MGELDKVRSYWDVISKSVPVEYKDHWVDEQGNPLDRALFDEIAVYVLKHLNNSAHRPRILEVGCGTGRILESINTIRQDLDLWGIDFSSEQIETARHQLKDRCNLFVGDLKEFASHTGFAGDNGFDLIFLHSVTQYFPSDAYFKEFVDIATSAIKPGGSLLLLDCPVTWYLEQMRGTPKSTVLTPLKNLIKSAIGYKPKVRLIPTTAKETIGNEVIEVPIFSGYWIDPENIKQLCTRNFESFGMELQSFTHKPIAYKKYRPNFICASKY